MGTRRTGDRVELEECNALPKTPDTLCLQLMGVHSAGPKRKGPKRGRKPSPTPKRRYRQVRGLYL